MASNRFGSLFTFTTWGESHGKAVGVVIDGCPAGIELNDEMINQQLALRAPGNSPFTSPRKEPDRAEILSGTFEGVTTGAPISILIWNRDADSSKYEPIKDRLRPGHANYTYLQKYGLHDHCGSGRASARETACRVAAGAVAKELLKAYGIETLAYLQRVGEHQVEGKVPFNREQVAGSMCFCPDPLVEKQVREALLRVKEEGDSLGGVVAFQIEGVPAGLGDPIYEKLEANLAKAMLSIPASKGFELGSGFDAVSMPGSTHNDVFTLEEGGVKTASNHAGGVLGGITTGMPIEGKVAFKPTSSVMKPQPTLDVEGNPTTITLPEGSRHDPCVAIRAVPVVEAMASCVVADALLMNKSARMERSLAGRR